MWSTSSHFDHIAAAKRGVDRMHTIVLTIARCTLPQARPDSMEGRERSSGVDLTLPRSIILTDRSSSYSLQTGIIGKTWKTGSTEHKRGSQMAGFDESLHICTLYSHVYIH
jgi:hypothetical protein